MSDACLRHVLTAEGEGWFHPEKLTSVIYTFVNSRLNMSVQRDKSDFAKRPVPVCRKLEAGGVNKSFYTPGPTKSNTFVGENKVPRCTNCHKFGHFAKNCWSEKGATPTPRSFDKNTKQTAQTAAPKLNSTGQRKVNHVNVQSDMPTYLHHACLADKISTKLHFPPQKAHEEVNNVLRGMEFLDAKIAQGNDVEGQDGMTPTLAGPTKSRPEPSGAVRSRPEPPGAVRRPDAARSRPESSGHRPDAARSRPDAARVGRHSNPLRTVPIPSAAPS